MDDLEIVVRYCEKRARDDRNRSPLARYAYRQVAKHCRRLMRSREEEEYERILAMGQDC